MNKSTSSLSDVFNRHGVAIVIVLLLILGFFYTASEVTMAGNEATRLGTVQCLVDLGTFALEDGMFKTVDRVIMNNHIYSDKPLLLSTLVSVPYRLIKNLLGFSFSEHYYLMVFLLNYICFYSLNILMFWLFHKMIREKLPDSAPSFLLFCSAALIFSTMLFSYSVAINNHTPAAAVTLILLFCLGRYEKNPASWLAAVIGVLTGTLLNFEFVFGCVFGVSSFFLVALSGEWKIRWRQALLYAAGAFAMIGVNFGLNYIAFGTVIPLYSETHKIEWNSRILIYMFNSTFGFKGIFLYMPALLFIIPIVLKLKRTAKERIKTVMLLSLGIVIVLYWLLTGEYGGWSFGFRYLIPVVPIMFYYIVLDLRNWGRGLKHCLFYLCVGWGVVVSQLGAYNPWCISYEAHITGERYARFKNSFLGNFFCWSFEHYPEHPVTRWQIEFYGNRPSAVFLMDSYVNTKNIEMMQKTAERFQHLSPSEPVQ
jgi:hypothetical protein